MKEVEARVQGTARPISPSVTLPGYVPIIQHGYKWSGRLSLDVVAIPTSEVISGRGLRFGPRFDNVSDLRDKFHLRPDTQVLLVSVGKDQFLERYWRLAKQARTAERLAELDIAGITIPNFSFFSDAPRFHHLYNRRRHEACLNELAEAGVPVVPHVHALTTGDLAYWRGWLREHVEIRHVCREFQTGNDEGAIDELGWLQDKIGRALHPIIVGGARFAARLRAHFKCYTIADSTPFMHAVKRQRAIERDSGGIDWQFHPTSTAKDVGALLKHNIKTYRRRLEAPPDYQHQLSMLELFEQLIRAQATSRSSKQISLPFVEGHVVRLPVLVEQDTIRRPS